MKCPGCGVENPEYAFYCGRCAHALKEVRSQAHGDDGIVRPPQPVVDFQPRVLTTPSEWVALALLLVIGIVYVIEGVIGLLGFARRSTSSGTELSYFPYFDLIGGVSLAFYAMAVMWISKSKWWRATHRLSMPAHERRPAIAEVKCFNLAEMATGFLIVCAFLIVPIIHHSQMETFEIIVALMVPCVIIVVLAVFPRPVLGLEERGIFLKRKWNRNEAFLSWPTISSVRIRNKLVRISLRGAPVYARHWYLLFLGDASKFKQELERLNVFLLPAEQRPAG